MKKMFLVLISSAILTSCSVLNAPDSSKLVPQITLGMSKEEAIGIMGERNSSIESISNVPEGLLEVIRFNYISSPDYLFYFINGRLVELHRYIPPVTNQPVEQNVSAVVKSRERTIHDDIVEGVVGDAIINSNSGGKKKVRKDIFGDTIIEDSNGNKTTVKKDIFGDTIIKDDKGNKKTVKKDIFGNTIIEDSDGNKTTVKKDIFGNTIIEDSKGNKKTIKKDIFGDYTIE